MGVIRPVKQHLMTRSAPPSRRFWLRVALLLLPLLFARALLPSGFMAAATDSGVSITFCGDSGSGGSAHDGHGDRTCPFAMSGGSAPLPSLPSAPIPFFAASIAPAPVTSVVFASPGPTRQHASRAPPFVNIV
jgi:hypothetical protein